MSSISGHEPPEPTWLYRARIALGVITLIGRAMRRCFFGVLAAFILLLFFIWPPQGKEILSLAVEDAEWTSGWWLYLVAGATALAAITWYSSRHLLMYHDVVDTNLQVPVLQVFQRRLDRWFPRVLGALCILPLTFFLADAGVRTHVLNSPLLIVAACALLAAIDVFHGYLRCRLYRWTFLSSLLFVLLAHRWANEVPWPQKASFANILPWLFKLDADAPGFQLATTGTQVVIAVVIGLALDYGCRRWSRTHRDAAPAGKDRRALIVALLVVAVASMALWTFTFWHALLPRARYVVPLMLVVAVVVIAFFTHRRDWFSKMFEGSSDAESERDGDSTAARAEPVSLPPITRKLLWAAFIVGAIVFLLIWFKPIGVGQALGTPALLVIALAIWVVFGGVGLTLVPKAYRLPGLGLVPLIVAGCNSIGDTPITISRVETPATRAAFQRPRVTDSFTRWAASPGRPADGPIYLVAAAGGGIRAGFLTASYLAAADDVTNGDFGKRVFVISGVSGGSLGAAVYTQIGDGTSKADCPESAHLPAAIGKRQRAALCILGNDFLSPTVATFLFPDLLRTFWVPSLLYKEQWQDRGRTLEKAWTESLDQAGAAAFSSRFLDYAAGAASSGSTNLVLNATRVQSGHRVYASTFTWDALNAVDLFDPSLDTADTSMVGAVHNSARFTYVSPAGAYMRNTKDHPFAGQVADGGYFDNSGVLSLLEILDDLRTLPGALRERLHVIVITNDGSEKRICDGSPPGGEASEVQLTAPVVTFLAARPARAELSKAELRRYLSRGENGSERKVCDGLSPVGPLIEVSLNNALVADFLEAQRDKVYTGECDARTVPLPNASEAAQHRTPQTGKEIAVRVNEAPLGWTLSAATTDWLTRYARLAACRLPR